jgi:hypothetical protein
MIEEAHFNFTGDGLHSRDLLQGISVGELEMVDVNTLLIRGLRYLF